MGGTSAVLAVRLDARRILSAERRQQQSTGRPDGPTGSRSSGQSVSHYLLTYLLNNRSHSFTDH